MAATEHGDSDADEHKDPRSIEGTVGRFVSELLESSLVHSTVARALEARERAAQAQAVAMAALNLPSASDLERLTRRLRSVSQRLEGLEDGVDRLEERLASIETQITALGQRLDGMAPNAPRDTPAT